MTGHPILYDPDCGFCRVSLAVVLRWDRHGRLRPVALGSEEAPRRAITGNRPKPMIDRMRGARTPTTVYGRPLMTRLLPTTRGSGRAVGWRARCVAQVVEVGDPVGRVGVDDPAAAALRLLEAEASPAEPDDDWMAPVRAEVAVLRRRATSTEAARPDDAVVSSRPSLQRAKEQPRTFAHPHGPPARRSAGPRQARG